MRKLTIGLVLILAIAYLATGVFVVAPNERGIVRRFGRAVAPPREPGLHIDLPRGLAAIDRVPVIGIWREKWLPAWGLATIDRVPVYLTQEVTIGILRPTADDPEGVESYQGRFLTGDQNLIDLRVTVEYQVSDPKKYLFSSTNIRRSIEDATESLFTERAATLPVDEIQVGAQVGLRNDLVNDLQVILDDYDLGVRVGNINFRGMPPPEVAEAFNDVVKAKSDKMKRVLDALSYEKQLIRFAEADSESLLNAALAYAAKRRAEGTSQAERFEEVLAAYRESSVPASVRRRLILETIEEVMPRMEKIIVSPGEGEPIDLSIFRNTSKE